MPCMGDDIDEFDLVSSYQDMFKRNNRAMGDSFANRHLEKNLAERDVIVIGLTGGMGMGKSTISKMITETGIPIFDVDAAVHASYLPEGPGYRIVEDLYPDAIIPEGVDRRVLVSHMQADSVAFRQLEDLMTRVIVFELSRFIRDLKSQCIRMAVVDAPLLYEMCLDKYMHVVVAACCTTETQRNRCMARPGMTEEKFSTLLARQIPADIKCKQAHYTIDTDKGIDDVRSDVETLLCELRFKLSR